MSTNVDTDRVLVNKLERRCSMHNSERVIVIGAGIGGLAVALELAGRGADVLVLERAGAPGGKLRQVDVDGQKLDAGPTVLTMRWVFDALFEQAGARLEDHLCLRPAGVLARHAWNADERLDLHADRQRSVDAIGRFAGAREARGYVDFCARAARTYAALRDTYLRAGKTTPWGLTARHGLRGLPALMGISPFTRLSSALRDHFDDPRLRQLFGRYATYCGASPYLAPATLMLVAHVEQEGVWLIDGGMQALAQAVASLAQQRGARLRCGAAVDEILLRSGRAAGVRLADGETIEADTLVFNGDVAALAAGRLCGAARAAVPPQARTQRSLSALTWNLVARAEGFPLLRHSVFFSPDYAGEFEDLLTRRRLPAEPTVYVCAQDRGTDDSLSAIDGPERLLCLVNAPPDGDLRPLPPEEIEACERQTFRRLERCGLRLLARADSIVRTTPSDFDRLFPATGGALYGPASHGWQAAFSRCGSRSRIPGLYLAGGSTHPGPGLPMATLSGQLAAACVLQDLARGRASMSMSSRTATPGGMSMR